MNSPQGWQIVAVADVAAAMFDGPFGSALKTSDYTDRGVRVARLENIGHLRFRGELESFVSQEKVDSLRRHLLAARDILFSSFVDKETRVCLVPDALDGRMINKADCFCIRTDRAICDPRFLVYKLAAPSSYDSFSGSVRGITRPRIGLRDLAAFKIDLPPLAEQRRIVAKLDALLSRLARARAELERISGQASKLRSRVVRSAFQGELSALWRASHQVEAGGSEKAQALPAGWRWTTLGDLTDIKSGITLGKKRPVGVPLIAVPYLRVANVQRGGLNLSLIKEIDVTPAEASSLYLQPGDILLNEGGDRDKLGRGWVWSGEIPNCIHQNHVFRARLVEKSHSPKYISYYANEFGQDYFFEHGTQTTNLASISKAKLSSLPIPLAPPEEQNLIVRLLEDAFARADRLEAEAARARALLDRLEAAILTKAFKGELMPQDPNDEAVSILLERIRAQRAVAKPAAKGKRRRLAV